MCPKVRRTENPCKYTKRLLKPASVARLIAGISNCRAATVVNATKAIIAAMNESERKDNAATNPEDKMTNK